jgi:geranylgeranylglycerol-phosphate geranylgeranyltransferase
LRSREKDNRLYMRAYLQLIRYGNCLMAAFSAAIGVLIAYNIISGTAGQIPFPLQEIIYVALVVCLVTGAGNAINDYYDIEIDRINKPERPIPSGRISKSKALYFSILLFASGTVIAFFINTICGVIALFNSLLLVYYAATLKRTVLIGNLSVGYLSLLVLLSFSVERYFTPMEVLKQYQFCSC